MNNIFDVWVIGWKIFCRLFLLNLAMTIIYIPFKALGYLVPGLPEHTWPLVLYILICLATVLPFGSYLAAKVCREFKEEMNSPNNRFQGTLHKVSGPPEP